jgi:hypothetical protein
MGKMVGRSLIPFDQQNELSINKFHTLIIIMEIFGGSGNSSENQLIP